MKFHLELIKIMLKIQRYKKIKVYLLKKNIRTLNKNRIITFILSILILSVVFTKDTNLIKASFAVLFQVVILSGFTFILALFYDHKIFFIKNKENISLFFIILFHIALLCFIPVSCIYGCNIVFFIYLKILFENNFNNLIIPKYWYLILYFSCIILVYFCKDFINLENIKILTDHIFFKFLITAFRALPAGASAASLSAKGVVAAVKGSNGVVLGLGLGAMGTGGVVIHLRSESLIRLENETAKRASLLAEAKETNRHLETMATLPVKVALKENQISIGGRVVFSQKKTTSIIPLEDL